MRAPEKQSMDGRGTESRGRARLQGIGRALRHRNYRLFFAGQSVSLIGTWLTRVATSWLVFQLTHSAWTLGLVGFVGQLPTFLLAPLAGVWVDRWDRHRVLLVTQVLALLQSGALAVLAIGGWIRVEHILVLSALQGVINAFDMPARQAFLVQMIENRADLPNAIALNSSMVNAARLIGPSVAGALIAAFGEGGCFLIDSLSYVAVIASLLAMHVVPARREVSTSSVWSELGAGFAYATRFVPVRSLLLLLAIVSLVGMPYTVLMPLIASDRLGGDAYTLGFLMAASGLGALCGALWLASRESVVGLGRVIAFSAVVFGAGLMAFSQSRSLWVSLPLMWLTGGGMMVQMAASNTVLQTIVDEEMRGRLMSFYSMAFFGTLPFGSLLAGVLSDRIGAPLTLGLGGMVCVAAGLVFLRELPSLRVYVRPIYVRLGIVSELAE
jgi:MFS family permease